MQTPTTNRSPNLFTAHFGARQRNGPPSPKDVKRNTSTTTMIIKGEGKKRKRKKKTMPHHTQETPRKLAGETITMQYQENHATHDADIDGGRCFHQPPAPARDLLAYRLFHERVVLFCWIVNTRKWTDEPLPTGSRSDVVGCCRCWWQRHRRSCSRRCRCRRHHHCHRRRSF